MKAAKLRPLLPALVAFATLAALVPSTLARAQQPSVDGARDATAPKLTLEAFAGLGLGSRGFERPLGATLQKLPDAAFFAAAAGLRAALFPEDAFSLAFLARYDTSLGLSVEQPPPFALPNTIHVRAEHIELSVAPTFRLTATPVPLTLSLPLGFSMRTFLPDLHNPTLPGFSLLGPSLRAELSARFGSRVSLRLGPELEWVFVAGQAVRRNGVDGSGFALGGEAVVAVKVVSVLALELAYRESHAFVSSRDALPDLRDVERFAILRAVGSL